MAEKEKKRKRNSENNEESSSKRPTTSLISNIVKVNYVSEPHTLGPVLGKTSTFHSQSTLLIIAIQLPPPDLSYLLLSNSSPTRNLGQQLDIDQSMSTPILNYCSIPPPTPQSTTPHEKASPAKMTVSDITSASTTPTWPKYLWWKCEACVYEVPSDKRALIRKKRRQWNKYTLNPLSTTSPANTISRSPTKPNEKT